MHKIWNFKNKRYLLVAAIIIAIFYLVNCLQQNHYDGYIDFGNGKPLVHTKDSDTSEGRPLRIVVSTVISPNVTIEDWRAFADYIGQRLGYPTVLLQRRSYKDIGQLLSTGDADMAFMSTGAYCSYYGMQPLEILAMIKYHGKLTYQSYLITSVSQAKINNFSDLRGKSIAFSDPLSYSGHMCVVKLLQSKYDTLPSHYFSNYIYTGSHDRSIWAVKNKIVDAACVDSLVYDLLQREKPQAVAGIKIFQKISGIPIGPIVVRCGLSEQTKEKLQQILFSMGEDQKMRKSLQNIMIDRFVEPQPHLYEPYKKIYDKVMTDR